MQRIKIIDTPKFIGHGVRLRGIGSNRRDHGKLIFLDLRDSSGIIQAVIIPDHSEAYKNAKVFDNEKELAVEMTGIVKECPMSACNEKLPTGSVELEVDSIEILDESNASLSEIAMNAQMDTKSERRYLDLRSDRMESDLTLHEKIEMVKKRKKIV